MNANNSMPAKMTLVEMVTDLINLIKKEELLRRHHRAYLHVRDDIHECCDALTAYINSTLIPTSEGDSPYTDPLRVCEVLRSLLAHDCQNCEDVVTISKEQYDMMVDDLLTMADMVTTVLDMRNGEIQALYEANCNVMNQIKKSLTVTNAAEDHMESILERWEDEFEDDIEPDEYFSD